MTKEAPGRSATGNRELPPERPTVVRLIAAVVVMLAASSCGSVGDVPDASDQPSGPTVSSAAPSTSSSSPTAVSLPDTTALEPVLAAVTATTPVTPDPVTLAPRPPIPSSAPDNVVAAGLIDAGSLQFSCPHLTSDGADPRLGLEPVGEAVAQAIERVAQRGWTDSLADVDDWFETLAQRDGRFRVVGVTSGRLTEPGRWVIVELAATSDGGFRVVDWQTCRPALGLAGYVTLRVTGVSPLEDGSLAADAVDGPCGTAEVDRASLLVARFEANGANAVVVVARPVGTRSGGGCLAPRTYRVVLPGAAGLSGDTLDASSWPPVPPTIDGPNGEADGFTQVVQGLSGKSEAYSTIGGTVYQLGLDRSSGVAGGTFVIDAGDGSPGLLVYFEPGDRQEAEASVGEATAAAGLVDIGVIFEERSWSNADVRELASLIDQALREEFGSSTHAGDAGAGLIGVTVVPPSLTPEGIADGRRVVAEVLDAYPELSDIPVEVITEPDVPL